MPTHSSVADLNFPVTRHSSRRITRKNFLSDERKSPSLSRSSSLRVSKREINEYEEKIGNN